MIGRTGGETGVEQPLAGLRILEAAAEARLAREADPSVLLALTWFGVEGPYANWRGTDEVILALVGLAFAFGAAEGPPMLAQGHGPQLAGGLVAFNAAAAALIAPRA